MYQPAAMPPTVIAPELLAAYRNTRYVVHAQPAFALTVGEVSPALRQWMQMHACDSAVFMTACNPYSQARDDAENMRRQSDLERAIRRRGLVCVPGTGQPQAGHWKPEPSCLVGGLTLEEAQMLARQFEQNAVVWCGPDAVAQLLLLR